MDSEDPGTAARGGVETDAGFFDDYPRFFETSKVAAHRDRLNLRYQAIFAANRDVFEGASVLDLASHDGRWSLAALKTGAARVVGIEGRPELVASAESTFHHYGIARDRYRFVAGDLYDALAEVDLRFDVVLCLGFLYHTLRYNELLSHIRRLEPRYLIIDTGVATEQEPVVRVQVESVVGRGHAIADRYSWHGLVLSGRPSLAALRMMLGAYGFEVEGMSDWTEMLSGNPGARHVPEYAEGRRVTVRARALEAPPIDDLNVRGRIGSVKAQRAATPTSARSGMHRIARDFTPPILRRWVVARRWR
jgi:hypothetical protein